MSDAPLDDIAGTGTTAPLEIQSPWGEFWRRFLRQRVALVAGALILLVVLAVPGSRSLEAAGVYMATYLITALGVFGVIALVSSPAGERDWEKVSEYQGLFWKRPYLVSILTAMLLSLAGMGLVLRERRRGKGPDAT